MKQEPNLKKIYPRTNDFSTIYLKNVITNSNIIVNDFTMYNDFYNDPKDFEKKNVLYHYPFVNEDKLIIGKFCSIACGMPAKIIKKRFEDSVIEDLLKIQWWYWSTEKISKKLTAIRSGDIEALKEEKL